MITTEAEARSWFHSTFDVPRETSVKLDAFAAFLIAQSERQNLIARSTIADLWVRHIADSAQLAALADPEAKNWLDIGSGAGFPGLIAATLHGAKVTLIEPRRLRVAFLREAASILGVQVEIVAAKVERHADGPYDLVSARAFADLKTTLDVAYRVATDRTQWLLPKGRRAAEELAQARAAWQGDFRLVPSVTDADAKIVVATRVRPRGRRKETP